MVTSETDIERHLREVLSAQKFASSPVLLKTLEVLANLPERQKDLSVWDLTEMLYPSADEQAYNRTKAHLQEER